MRGTSLTVDTLTWRERAAAGPGRRCIPEETAVALTYNGTTHAVMMATPRDLEDYAHGFSLTERQITTPDQIKEIEVAHFDEGIDVRIWLDEDASAGFRDRRRRIAGPTGCGLCGIESLQEATYETDRIVDGEGRFTGAELIAAQAELFPAQTLHAETRAVHAAGYWRPGEGMVAVREDVGRHNALDKLVGAVYRAERRDPPGVLLLTSRVSVEMVQKASVLGAAVLVAVSAPTALAVRTAERAGITLVALARNDGFEVFTHRERVVE
ncbi:formate dehydrogenase accessory sulfurtransferase FdhD [Marivibrio halodurans]|uniref:Sulfur carrier protein FdhD n=1 Tax=Marivibrio halodurans TaxID=2039722 RepID=A0A8J7S7P2_9PROT|nr:formate dehydrogenase accessory sulfurtransferase FdhD [Marivibrio halodurans]MBP5858339.1 formate dehydrogenase accessory sulfurtransferase FdhD [Marivibrio halodurans]